MRIMIMAMLFTVLVITPLIITIAHWLYVFWVAVRDGFRNGKES